MQSDTPQNVYKQSIERMIAVLSRLLQESNVSARQPRRAPHHVIQATSSEGLAQGPYAAASGIQTSNLPHRRHRTPPISHHAPLAEK